MIQVDLDNYIAGLAVNSLLMNPTAQVHTLTYCFKFSCTFWRSHKGLREP